MNFFKELFKLDIREIDESIKRNEILDILKEINTLLNKSFEDYYETAWGVLSSIMQLQKVTKAVIFHYDDKMERFVPIFSIGIDKSDLTDFVLQNSELNTFFRLNRTFVIDDKLTKKYPVVKKLFRNFNIFSGIFEPIMVSKEVTDCILIADKLNKQEFDNHDIKLFGLMIPFYKLIDPFTSSASYRKGSEPS